MNTYHERQDVQENEQWVRNLTGEECDTLLELGYAEFLEDQGVPEEPQFFIGSLDHPPQAVAETLCY